MSLPLVLWDQREKRRWRFSPNVAIQSALLETGDYTVAGLSDRVCIERKSLSDYVNSCTHERDRFTDECRRMAGYDLLHTIIVEASMDHVWAQTYRSRAHPNSIIGTTIALHCDYGVSVIWAGDESTAANICERLLTRLWKKHVAEAAA